MPKRIFITHSTADEPIATALVRMLRAGTTFSSARIFSSSAEGQGVPTGEKFVEYIHQMLKDTALVIQLVTPAYLDSAFCQWELGATWALGHETFPFVIGAVDRDDLKGPLALRHMSQLNRQGLNRLHDAMSRIFRLKHSNTSSWEDARRLFLREVGSLQRKSASNYRGLPGHRRARALRFVDAATDHHHAMHLLRDAAFVKVRGSGTESLSEFMNLVKHSIELFASAFTKLTGTKCRVCVKQADVPGTRSSLGPMKVGDLFRSPPGKMLRKPKELDSVEGNTDFAVIMERDRDSFMSNDLVALWRAGEYQNTHWPEGPPKNPTYVATIVWPIRKLLDGTMSYPQTLEPLAEEVHLLGFLCVDTAVTNVFEEEPDLSFGAAYADTLYHVMAPWLREKELRLFRRKVG